MKKTFIYWDNSNIFVSAKKAAVNREGEGARHRLRVHFRNLLNLARAGRQIGNAAAVGSIPPELHRLWHGLEKEGVTVKLFERGGMSGREQAVDQALQAVMLRDMADHSRDPGIVVLLTGDGKGFYERIGFHADIKRMHDSGWGIEVLSWRHSCNKHMRHWAEENGVFVPLDDFYESITFLTPPHHSEPPAPPRYVATLDLSKRKTV